MADNSSVAGGGTLLHFGERFYVVQLLVSIFLCINMLLIVTLFSKVYFYTTMRYILFTVTLLSDTLILVITDILYILAYHAVTMPIALCVPVYIVVVVYTFVTPLTLTSMTLECYVAICIPLRHGELCTSGRALHCILIIHGLSFVPLTLILSIFFASAPTSLYSKHRICSMNTFVYLRWQDNAKMAVYQLYFFVMSATIIFSYIKIMKAAKKAVSGENKKSSRRAIGRVTLHGFHLLFGLIQLWCPFIETALLQIDLKLFLNVRYFNYILFNLTPRCLSPLLYGLRDEKVFLALKRNAPFQLHFGQNRVRIMRICENVLVPC